MPVKQLNKDLGNLIHKPVSKIEDQQRALSLIQQGADIKTQDPALPGNTLLLRAIVDDQIEFARTILALDVNKASINITDKLADQGNNTPLVLAIKKGYYDLAIELVELGADIDKCCGRRGITALQLACLFLGFGESSHDNESLLRLIKKLIIASTQPLVKNEYGVSALDLLHTYFEKDDFGFYVLINSHDRNEIITVPIKEVKPKQGMVAYKGKSYLAVFGDFSHSDSINLATTLCCNCRWHREDFEEHISEPRTQFLKSKTGLKMVAEIDEAFKIKSKTLKELKDHIKSDSHLAAQISAFERSLTSLEARDKQEIIALLTSLLGSLYADFVDLNTIPKASDAQIRQSLERSFGTFKAKCEEVLAKYKTSIASLVLGIIVTGATFIATGFFTALALSIGLSFMLSPPFAIFIGVVAGIIAGVLVAKTVYNRIPFFKNDPVDRESEAVKGFLKHTVDQDKLLNSKSNYSIFNDFIQVTNDPMVADSQAPLAHV